MTRRDERPRQPQTDDGVGDGDPPPDGDDSGDVVTFGDVLRGHLSRRRLSIVTGEDGRLRAVRAEDADRPAERRVARLPDGRFTIARDDGPDDAA